jgi:hypothetical protein
MNRKIIAGVSLGLLFTAFGVVSLLVILTKRHPYFVSKKLRLGAIILSLSGASVGCFPATCYVPAPSNLFNVDQTISQTDSIVVSRAASDTITGQIRNRNGNTFSYAIVNSTDSIVLEDNILPVDGTFDEDVEEFKIGFGPAIPTGKYDLKFYTVSKDSIKNGAADVRSFSLTITN